MTPLTDPRTCRGEGMAFKRPMQNARRWRLYCFFETVLQVVSAWHAPSVSNPRQSQMRPRENIIISQ